MLESKFVDLRPTSGRPSTDAVRIKFRPHIGLILGLHPANERRRYKVTASLIGWAQPRISPVIYVRKTWNCYTRVIHLHSWSMLPAPQLHRDILCSVMHETMMITDACNMVHKGSQRSVLWNIILPASVTCKLRGYGNNFPLFIILEGSL